MIIRKPTLIAMFIATAVIVGLAFLADQALVQSRVTESLHRREQKIIHTSHTRAKPEPQNLTDEASLGPFKLGGSAAPRTTPPTSTPAMPARDLKDSAHRLDTIDSVARSANLLFNGEGFNASSTINEQGMVQEDHQLSDGTAITTWLAPSADGAEAALRAQEAQLPNGEVIDRWFHDNGAVQQIQHQYDDSNSVSVYYYDNGTDVEAMRIIQNGREIFTRYDRSGRLLEKTIN